MRLKGVVLRKVGGHDLFSGGKWWKFVKGMG